MNTPPNLSSWQALEQHRLSLEGESLRNMFAKDATRFEQFQCSAAGIFVDYSKNLVNRQTMDLLFKLAAETQLEQKIQALLSGEIVNNTEGRPALHTALRNRTGGAIAVGGEDVMPGIEQVLERMAKFSTLVRDGEWLGHTGEQITDVINIGIGGSDLGPLMATEALVPFAHERLRFHYVSNVDGAHLVSTLAKVRPESTLFIVASKTFTTQETLSNAHSARRWLLDSGAPEAAIAKHFVALSTNSSAVAEFGIDTNNMFEFWDWVGGRYSLWSAIGLSVMLCIGAERFNQFLEGAHEMDKHFASSPLDKNLPVILALLTVWYNNFYGYTSHMIAPYDQYLHRFPAYLQQLTMESNGKSVHRDGSTVQLSTGPIVWGEPGTNGQHAFFQLVHQGTHVIPVDFIVPLESNSPLGNHHEILLANCFAQSEALMMGKNAEELTLEMHAAGRTDEDIDRLKGHRTFSGNRPSNTITMQRLDPHALGALIALYEHKVYVEASIWDINPFDQWGVELGKQLAKSIHAEIETKNTVTAHDSSTNGLINRAIKFRNLQA